MVEEYEKYSGMCGKLSTEILHVFEGNDGRETCECVQLENFEKILQTLQPANFNLTT